MFRQVNRSAFTVAGLFFVGLGIIGFVTPVMPGTIFMILALSCFRRGESKFEHKLLAHKTIGPVLRDWDEHGAIKPKTKILAISLIWLAIGGSCFSAFRAKEKEYVPLVVGVLLAVAISLTIYLWTRPNAPEGKPQKNYS